MTPNSTPGRWLIEGRASHHAPFDKLRKIINQKIGKWWINSSSKDTFSELKRENCDKDSKYATAYGSTL